MKGNMGKFAQTICKIAIKESKHGKWDSAVEKAMHSLRLRSQLNPLLVFQVLTHPGLENYPGLAHGFFNWASQQPGYTHNLTSYQAMINTLLNSKQFRTVDNVLKQLKPHGVKPDKLLYTTILKYHLKAKKLLEAYHTYKESCSQGIKLGSVTCNSLLACLASSGRVDFAEAVYHQMRTDNIRLDFMCFGVFINAFCRRGDIKKTIYFINKERVSIHSFKGSIVATLVINGLCKESRLDEAMYVLDELRVMDCKPDIIGHCVIIKALKESEMYKEAHKIVTEKNQHGITPRHFEYKNFIMELIKDKKIKEALELTSIIKSSRFRVSEEVYNAVIGSLSSSDPGAALDLCVEMLDTKQSPSDLTVCNLARGLFNSRKMNEIWRVFELLRLNKVKFDLATWNLFMFLLSKAGKTREAYAVLEAMKSDEIRPTVETYNSLLDGLCKGGMQRPAKRLWDEMFKVGCDPSVATYQILVLHSLRNGDIQESEDLYRNMLGKGLVPDIVIFKSLIYELARLNKVCEACKIYDDYLKMGLGEPMTVPPKVKQAHSQMSS